MLGLVGAIWGFSGLMLIIVYAIIRLTPIAIDTFSYNLLWYHWLVLILNTIFMAHSEGYRGFHKGFAPRVVARCKYLKNHPKFLHVFFAPLFAAGYFFSTRKRVFHIFGLTVMIIVFIQIIHRLDQPWRGLLDVGVVSGLTWGTISLFIFAIRAMTAEKYEYSPELPGHHG
ncbi:hypothetical protein IIC38_20180 [candidate division KSB1 bacterium]|nr:hypothetical protein [candidate division KSB1 bacterium]